MLGNNFVIAGWPFAGDSGAVGHRSAGLSPRFAYCYMQLLLYDYFPIMLHFGIKFPALKSARDAAGSAVMVRAGHLQPKARAGITAESIADVSR